MLQSSARAVRLVDELAGTDLERRLIADLGLFESPALGIDGATIYRQALGLAGQHPPRDEDHRLAGGRTSDPRG